MKFNRFLKAASELLMTPEKELVETPSNFGIKIHSNWDSLAHLALMSELEEITGRELSIEDMGKMDTLPKILEYINN